MSFIYPSFFWALLLIGIPIIIHLFDFRIHKTVYFSNIRFLQNIKEVSESKSKIKNLLILLARILTLIMLVTAFARPYIPLIEKQQVSAESVVCIFLDNSYSMNAGGKYGNLFDAAKERARMLVNSYDNNQKFLLLTSDLEGKHRILSGKQQILQFIADLELSYAPKNISEIITYKNNFLETEFQNKKINQIFYLISDFQKCTSDFENFVSDSNSVNYLLPLATGKVNNIYIDSCWFSSPGRNLNKQEELLVRIVNKGDEEYQDIPVRLYVNDKQKAVNSFEIEANSTKTIVINYTNTETGLLPSRLELTDYPITYDNSFYFSYRINQQTSILIINNKNENKYLNALFKSDSTFIVENNLSGNIRSSEFSKYQLIVLDELESYSSGLIDELTRFVSQGGVLVIIPGENTHITELNHLTNALQMGNFQPIVTQLTQIEKINFEHYIYKDVFLKQQDRLKLPEIKKYFPLIIANQSVGRVLLNSVAGKPMLLQNNYQKGKVYTFSFPMVAQNSDFVVHPLFVPTFYNIAAYSQVDEKLSYIVGFDKIVDVALELQGADESVHVVDNETNNDFIPQLSGIGERGIRLNLFDNIQKAGNYSIVENIDTLMNLSFNYDRKESDPAYYNNNELIELVEKLQIINTNLLPVDLDELKVLVEDSLKERKEMWKLFVLFGLLFIITEIVLIRFWKS